MQATLFWFNDEQWAKIEPLLPTNQLGPARKDDRRILSGIMHVLKVGCRWVDCPPEYGPHKTIYNRFNRWSTRGIWQRIALVARAGRRLRPHNDRRVNRQLVQLTAAATRRLLALGALGAASRNTPVRCLVHSRGLLWWTRRQILQP